jgi:3-oxoacyl-[acyl-carrier protein] reductase
LVHWLAGAYAKKGITVNGVAPALIEETKMLPGASAELAASKLQLRSLRSEILNRGDLLTT